MSEQPRPYEDEREERRILVELHYPLEMGLVADLLKAIARAYPDAVVDEQGRVWNRRA